MNTLIGKHAVRLFAMAVVISLCTLLAGCGQSAQSSSAASSSASASTSFSSESVEESLTFGEKTSTALSIVFTNDTGTDITALSATPATGGGEAVQLMKAQDMLPAGKQATVYVEPGTSNGVYNLSFTSGASSRELHNIDFKSIEKASIRVEGKTTYISTTVDGKTVSTLDDELAYAGTAVAAAGTAAAGTAAGAAAVASDSAGSDSLAAQSAGEAEPAQDEGDAVEPEDNQDPDANGEGFVEYYDDSYADDAPAQSEDGCVTDVVLN